MSKLPIIGISLGDVNGIGPEVVIKTLLDIRIAEYCTPVVYGSPKIISYWKKAINHPDFNIHIIKSIDQIHHKKANILVCWEEEVEIKPGEVTEAGGKYAFKSLEAATKDLKAGNIHALVTAPLNKHNVNSDTLPFSGHTEYLAQQEQIEAENRTRGIGTFLQGVGNAFRNSYGANGQNCTTSVYGNQAFTNCR
jgi:4-hydroxythreonine-4-phosphate dehydrogenase